MAIFSPMQDKPTDETARQADIVMTLLVRNEADIIEDNIRFHHRMGVGQFIVMDNLSTDETPEILKQLSKDIPIRVIRQENDNYDQAVWVTEMAREAARLAPGGWVINNDADEFWAPLSGSLGEFLAAMPDHVTRIDVPRHNAVLESGDGPALAASAHPRITTLFERVSTNPLGVALPSKCLHRASPDIRVAQGNHAVEGLAGEAYDATGEMMILHYPYRTLSAYRAKIALGGAAYGRNTTLPEGIGITWREQYKMLDSDGIEKFWESQARSPRDVLIECSNGELFTCDMVRDMLTGRTETAGDPVTPMLDDLLAEAETQYRDLAAEISQYIARVPRDLRPTRPIFHNLEYCLNGPKAQISQLQRLRGKGLSARDLLDDFGMLRDAFSLFPRNDGFRRFLGDLLKLEFGTDAEALARDCAGKIVMLHVTCAPRTDKALASQASFGDDPTLHHILVVGEPGFDAEHKAPLRFSYKDGMLRVPAPDFYEALHRKVFYALMLMDLLTAPRLVMKLDDNLHLLGRDVFMDRIDRIEAGDYPCSGRVVGSEMHMSQWHGWHIGKCFDKTIERRGYQFPLPDRYAAGGYGYVLNRKGLEACSYMYLAMMGFFSMSSVGLEDAFIGHAMDASGLEVYDISTPQEVAAFPGLTSLP